MAVLQQAQLESALTRALALAQCLAALHAGQQMHGGLCPQALAFQSDGSVRLTPPQPPTLALSPQQLRYASPEQAGRAPVVDARSDLYSLGLILYEWLLGRAAFDCSDALELAYRQISVLATAPHAVNPGVPLQVSELVMRLLAKSPDARYASAQGLADDVQRCLHELGASGQVARFTLGSTDQRSQFAFPEQLYGRADDMAALLRLWRCAAKGELHLGLVRATAGLGKTQLVRALRDTVLACGGMLVEGRFEAHRGTDPYQALIEVFKTLLRQILAGEQAERAHWRERLMAALGPKVAVVQELLPEMEWIAGRHPPAPLMVGLAAQQRMGAALMDLLVLFAGPEHPLLLFLDDLQWADMASLAFIRAALREGRCSHLLVLAACQDEAFDTSPVLTQWLDALHREGASLSQVYLAPLSAEDVAALINDTCPHINALAELTALVMQRTLGNPQALRECLLTLVAQGRLRYEPLSKGWRWSPKQRSVSASKLWWT